MYQRSGSHAFALDSAYNMYMYMLSMFLELTRFIL